MVEYIILKLEMSFAWCKLHFYVTKYKFQISTKTNIGSEAKRL